MSSVLFAEPVGEVGSVGCRLGAGGGLSVAVVVVVRSVSDEEEGRPWPRASWAGLREGFSGVLSVTVTIGPRGGYACPFVTTSPLL